MSLRLVGDEPKPIHGHSVHVDQLAEMERLVEVVWLPARLAAEEMQEAIERRDVDALIAACRRLSSAGELGRLSAQRLQQGGQK